MPNLDRRWARVAEVRLFVSGVYCQSALNILQVTALKSFHVVGPQARTHCLVYTVTDGAGWRQR